MSKIDDIISYYELEDMNHVFLNVKADVQERLAEKIRKIADAGIGTFAKMEIITSVDDEYIQDFAEGEFDRAMQYADDEDSYITIGTPENMLSIADKNDTQVEVGTDWEYEYDTCTAYFDRSFGNYLPDYETHTLRVTVYMDLTECDGLYVETNEFEKALDEALAELS